MKSTNTIVIASLLLGFTLSSTVFANSSGASVQGEYTQLEVGKNLERTMKNLSKEKSAGGAEQWFFYEVDMEPNNGMPCCFMSEVRSGDVKFKENEMGCDLDKRSNSWGSSHQRNIVDSKTLSIYYHWKEGELNDMFLAGSECPVYTGKSQLTQLTGVRSSQSLAYLVTLAEKTKSKSNRRSANHAIAGIALHQGDSAHVALEKIANSNSKSKSHDAIFWLGVARNEAGYHSLAKIVDDSSRSEKSKKQAVFALSQNSSDKATSKLVELVKQNQSAKIQGEALFWLAESKSPQAFGLIKDILDGAGDDKLSKKAVFALSQIQSTDSNTLLRKIALSHSSSKVQKEAIFWLSQESKNSPLDLLINIATGKAHKNIREHAVFAISQLKGDEGINGLIHLLKSDSDRSVKKKALFWLGQSEHPKALSFIEKTLVSDTDS
ncbi:MAG: HEAT repeat domain-containing protein [Kangiellaceae bacterium]|nr:HEAT repeat domain-containing protein [Kangiellaceae bacterium]MCW8997754.1 HEAT repeat domain-containing protein [Kangiellaceae bacterium]MCW9015391.1 HEAT repeat domain-containing protein [Kangiellaceae bacterium]